MPRSDTNTYHPSDDGWEDLGSDVDEREWDLNNEQHKYRRPSTSQSIRTTVRYSWHNPSLENTKCGIRDIVEELRPVVAEKVGKATGWLRSFGRRTSDPSDAGENSVYYDASSFGELSQPTDQVWTPEPNVFSTGYTCGKEGPRRRSTGDDGARTDYGERRPESNALKIGSDFTLGNRRDTGDTLSKYTEIPKDPRYKSRFANNKEKGKLEAGSSRGGWSALKDAAKEPNTVPPYNKHATEPRTERRARIRAEWEKK